MQTTRRSQIVYALLAGLWLLVLAWQALEHSRMRESAREALLNRARDISGSLAVVVRSQGRGGVVPRFMIEGALNELTKSEELQSVVLLNSAGEVTAAAGEPLVVEALDLVERGERWSVDTVAFVNLVDLGAGMADGGPPHGPPIVLPGPSPEDGQGPPDLPSAREARFFGLFLDLDDEQVAVLEDLMSGEPLDEAEADTFVGLIPEHLLDGQQREGIGTMLRGEPLTPDKLRTIGAMLFADEMNKMPRPEPGRPFFRRPPWVSRQSYQKLLDEQGVHWFVISLSLDAFHARVRQDVRMRGIVAGIALLAMAALALGWHGVERSARLQIGLARAEDVAAHFKDMSVAAAGLAHETRNPLNLVRGQAHMIAQHDQANGEIRKGAREITEEVDRVTARLNQFMDYSRPLEPKPAPVRLNALVGDVARALESDLEDKEIRLDIRGPDLTVEADESLLRQVLFNLILNAIQAVDTKGSITVALNGSIQGGVRLEVQDDGAGVPEEDREDVFRPYYTTFEGGTGLGLAVVRQIALAHGWDIQCLAGDNGGAVFRISNMKPMTRRRGDPVRP